MQNPPPQKKIQHSLLLKYLQWTSECKPDMSQNTQVLRYSDIKIQQSKEQATKARL